MTSVVIIGAMAIVPVYLFATYWFAGTGWRRAGARSPST